MNGYEEKDIRLAAALACGSTWEQAARAAGVSESTLNRRLKDPAFRALVRGIRQASVDRATGLLVEGLADASTMIRMIATDGESERNRLAACIALLDIGLKYHEHTGLSERVRALEEGAGGGEQSGGAGGEGGAGPGEDVVESPV